MPTSTLLAGREHEQLLATQLVDDPRRGQGATLVIEGEAGIGKTRLARHVIDHAASAGVPLLEGEAHPFERTRPFGALGGIGETIGEPGIDPRCHSASRREVGVGTRTGSLLPRLPSRAA